MARQLQEIRVFNSGIISNPDETDIPIEAASNSLNIDSVSKDGVLTGLPGDTTIAIAIDSEIDGAISPSDNNISSIQDSGAEILLLKTDSGNWVFANPNT